MIREMKYKDIEAVNTLLAETFRDEYGHLNVDTEKRLVHMKRGYFIERVVSLLFTGYDKFLDFFVYEEENSIRGCLRVMRLSEMTFYFATVAVDQNHTRRGIAFSLQEHCEALCRKRGGKYITLVIKEENVPSLQLVEKSGFTIYDENYMFILDPLHYENKCVEGFRPLKREDYTRIGELEKAIMSEEVVTIEGVLKYSLLNNLTSIFRYILFGEKFFEYVFEKGDKITAYAKVSRFVDSSVSMILMVHGDSYSTLKDFTEKILYLHAQEKMRIIIGKDQLVERKILTELGFKEYSHLYAYYMKLRD